MRFSIRTKIMGLCVTLLVAAIVVMSRLCLFALERNASAHFGETSAVAPWLLREWALACLILLALGTIFSLLYSFTITVPLGAMIQAVRRLAEGDFGSRVPRQADPAQGWNDEMSDLSTAFNEMVKRLGEREHLARTLRKFHDPKIAAQLVNNSQLGGKRHEAVVLFCDVRDFTRFCEGAPAEVAVATLNEYFTSMVNVIHRFGGVIDKFLGDGILAFWGVPNGQPTDAEQAVRAAQGMRQSLVLLNASRQQRGESALRIGIGLNLGPVIAGNIGSADRMEFTLIGDTVNVAARVESLTKEFQADILITGAVHERVKKQFHFRAHPGRQLRGRDAPVEVFELV